MLSKLAASLVVLAASKGALYVLDLMTYQGALAIALGFVIVYLASAALIAIWLGWGYRTDLEREHDS